MALQSAEINLVMGNPNENCVTACQENEGVCIDKLQAVFDKCDYHKILQKCQTCQNGEIAGFQIPPNDTSADEKTCIKLPMRSTKNNLCDSPTNQHFQPLCACQMKPRKPD